MEGWRTGLYVRVRFWVKDTSIPTRTRINDRGVKSLAHRPAASQPSAATGCTRMHGEPRRKAAAPRVQQPGREGQSRRQLCETRRNIFTFSVKDGRSSGRHETLQNKTRKESTHCLQKPSTLLLLLLLLLFFLSASSLRAPQSTSPSLRWTFPAAYSLIDFNVAG